MKVVKIENIINETPTIKSLFFSYDDSVKPGQFYMIWIPGYDEIPMSVSYSDGLRGITVKNIGKATEKLHEMKVGDKIGIRGPFGNHFIPYKKGLVVGGGVGLAALRILFLQNNLDILYGAVTKDELLYFEEIKNGMKILTDDGSYGDKGFVTDALPQLLKENNYEIIYTCGPEIMMNTVLKIALENNVKVQASLERYMKCGIGICDSCSIDGYRVCKDGPIFNEEQLRNMEEFGKIERDACGLKRSI